MRALVALTLALATAPLAVVAQTNHHVEPLGALDYPDDCTGAVWVDGQYAYIARGHDGVAIVDLSDPHAPSPAALAVPEADASRYFVSDVMVADGRLYVSNAVPNGTDLPSGVYVFDVSDPRAPVKLGEMTWGEGGGFHFGANVSGLWVEVTATGRHHVYVASRTTGMIELFDFTDPRAPFYIVTVNGPCDWREYPNLPPECYAPRPGYALDVTVRDGVAYAAMGDGGLLVFDVADPAEPVELAHVTWPDTWVRSLALDDAGEVLYAVEQRSTGYLRSLDVRDPGAIVELDRFRGRSASIPARVAVDGDRLWLTHHEDGVYALDARDPAALRPIAQYTPRPGAPYYRREGHDGLFAGGGLAFVGDSDLGFQVLAVEGDVLTVHEAQYSRRRSRLTLRVTSSAAASPLYGIEADGYGPLTYDSRKGRWTLDLDGVPEPATVALRSTLGAEASTPVDRRR